MHRRDRLSRCMRKILTLSISLFRANCKDVARIRLAYVRHVGRKQDLFNLIDYGGVLIRGKMDRNFPPVNEDHLLRLYDTHRIPPV